MVSVDKYAVYLALVALAGTACSKQEQLAGSLVGASLATGAIAHYSAQPGERSPVAAAAFGFFPGFGAGHDYAGRKAARIAISVVQAMGLGLWQATLYAESPDEVESLATTGKVLFYGAWLYDIIHAPVAAKRHNQKVRVLLTPAGGGVTIRF